MHCGFACDGQIPASMLDVFLDVVTFVSSSTSTSVPLKWNGVALEEAAIQPCSTFLHDLHHCNLLEVLIRGTFKHTT